MFDNIISLADIKILVTEVGKPHRWAAYCKNYTSVYKLLKKQLPDWKESNSDIFGVPLYIDRRLDVHMLRFVNEATGATVMVDLTMTETYKEKVSKRLGRR